MCLPTLGLVCNLLVLLVLSSFQPWGSAPLLSGSDAVLAYDTSASAAWDSTFTASSTPVLGGQFVSNFGGPVQAIDAAGERANSRGATRRVALAPTSSPRLMTGRGQPEKPALASIGKSLFLLFSLFSSPHPIAFLNRTCYTAARLLNRVAEFVESYGRQCTTTLLERSKPRGEGTKERPWLPE